MKKILWSSKSDEWETPQDVYDALHVEFDFQIDLAATPQNAKCEKFFTTRDDALGKSWHADAERGWLNPPYSRPLGKAFIEKAAAERLLGFTTVLLLPARTDTRAFHWYIYDRAKLGPRRGVEIRFLAGRLRFVNEQGHAGDAAPFPSMVVVMRPTPPTYLTEWTTT